MLILSAPRIALIALNAELAALQASSRTAFFNALAVKHEPLWPPAPFERDALLWPHQGLTADPTGEGWYGWAVLANEGELAPPRIIGIVALIGRPDEDGDVELAFGMVADYKGASIGVGAVGLALRWALANGARRVIAHFDAEDLGAAAVIEENGFSDTYEPPYPGVARWALSAA